MKGYRSFYGCAAQRPLLGVKRTWRGLVSMSANDPKRTLDPRHRLSAQGLFLEQVQCFVDARFLAAYNGGFSIVPRLRSDSAVNPPNLGVLGLVNQSEIRAKG